MNRLIQITIAASCLITSACGVSSGFMRDTITYVKINEAGFKYVKKNVTGEAEKGAFDDGDALYKNAMEALHKNADLGDNQALVNIREDIIWKGAGLQHRVLLTADVIEFDSAGVAAAPAPAPTTEVDGDMTSVDGGVISSEDAPVQKKKKSL